MSQDTTSAPSPKTTYAVAVHHLDTNEVRIQPTTETTSLRGVRMFTEDANNEEAARARYEMRPRRREFFAVKATTTYEKVTNVNTADPEQSE